MYDQLLFILHICMAFNQYYIIFNFYIKYKTIPSSITYDMHLLFHIYYFLCI